MSSDGKGNGCGEGLVSISYSTCIARRGWHFGRHSVITLVNAVDVKYGCSDIIRLACVISGIAAPYMRDVSACGACSASRVRDGESRCHTIVYNSYPRTTKRPCHVESCIHVYTVSLLTSRLL